MKNIITDIIKRIFRKIRYLTIENKYLKLFMFHFWNIFYHGKCYITCSGKRDGAGAQALAIMSTMVFAEEMHIKYIHTPFATLQHNYENDADYEKKWENLFNLGKDELKMDDDRLKISQVISLGEDPFKIRKQNNTLYVLRHCHDYVDLFQNKYSRINNRLIEKYYARSKMGFELNYEPKKVNIAVHLRRGDVNGSNQFRDKFTENKFIVGVLNKILEIVASVGAESSICVYSEGELKDFKDLERLNPKFFLNTNPLNTFHNLVSADVLVMSKSTFAFVAALLSKGIVFYESFRHQPQNNWIKVNKFAKFCPNLLSEKLRNNISDRQ